MRLQKKKKILFKGSCKLQKTLNIFLKFGVWTCLMCYGGQPPEGDVLAICFIDEFDLLVPDDNVVLNFSFY